jgi:hypothetical protein
MTTLPRLLAACAAAACLTVPAIATAGVTGVSCSVAVDYTHNGALGHAYRKDFTVTDEAPFFDDFSSVTRIRQFAATVSKNGGDSVVSIDYFNDVGVFTSIGFNTSLAVNGSGNAGRSTSGSHSTYNSNIVAPAVVGGTHTTTYTLTCNRI